MIETPCIKVCTLDSASGLCTGCGRSLDEIGRWGSMSDAERAAIMAVLAERMRAHFGAASEHSAGQQSLLKP
jgi:predicted Fe-S protein YdhL (DUF1289 family)